MTFLTFCFSATSVHKLTANLSFVFYDRYNVWWERGAAYTFDGGGCSYRVVNCLSDIAVKFIDTVECRCIGARLSCREVVLNII